MSEWSHLPNASHIDRVLAHMKSHPDQWTVAWDAAWTVAWDAAWAAAWAAARDTAWAAARDAAWTAGRDAAQDAASALVAWDDCAYMLDLPPDAVQMLIETGDETTRHQAVLLLPAVIALSNERSTT